MTKRKFKGQELVFATRGLENKKQEKDWIEYQIEYHDLMLKTGLKMNYQKNVRDFKQQKHDFEGDLAIVNETISVLQKQIREGVDVKEDNQKED